MEKYKRIFVVVMDSFGVGAMEDSPQFGDVGVDTLGHISGRWRSLDSESAKAGTRKSASNPSR